VSQKNIPDRRQTIFLTQLAIKCQFSYPPHPVYDSALPRESRSSEICIKRNRKTEKTFPTLSIVPWI